MMKKRIFLVAVAICCLALAGTGTAAFFVAQGTAFNVITTGEMAMDLVETTTDDQPFPEEGIHGVMPGMTYDKKVVVQNIGGVDFYTRILLTGEVLFDDGTTQPLDLTKLELDIDTVNWTKQGDYYYYNRALTPRGEDGVVDVTEPLFTTVTFVAELGNEYQNATVKLDVNAEAVQSRNNTDSALTAAGWASN